MSGRHHGVCRRHWIIKVCITDTEAPERLCDEAWQETLHRTALPLTDLNAQQVKGWVTWRANEWRRGSEGVSAWRVTLWSIFLWRIWSLMLNMEENERERDRWSDWVKQGRKLWENEQVSNLLFLNHWSVRLSALRTQANKSQGGLSSSVLALRRHPTLPPPLNVWERSEPWSRLRDGNWTLLSCLWTPVTTRPLSSVLFSGDTWKEKQHGKAWKEKKRGNADNDNKRNVPWKCICSSGRDAGGKATLYRKIPEM